MNKNISNHCATYTKEDIEYIINYWGDYSILTIAKNLQRKPQSICDKARNLGLPPYMEATGLLTTKDLANAFDCTQSKIYNVWRKNGLKLKKKKIITGAFYYIDSKDFWKWAEGHKELVDLKKYERNTIAPDPVWIVQNIPKLKNHHIWTANDVEKLIYLYKDYNLSPKEIAKYFGLSTPSINSKINKLIRAGKLLAKAYKIRWTYELKEQLYKYRLSGKSYDEISKLMDLKISLHAYANMYSLLKNDEKFQAKYKEKLSKNIL